MTQAKNVDAKSLKAWLSDDRELALFDIRELGPYSEGHPFFAVPLPYSRLELDAERLAPRKSVRMVLLDGGDGLADRAAARLAPLGFTDIHVLAGGAPAWKAAGYTLYEGVNVPSKAFGEVVEIERHTPRITADDLIAMQARQEDMVIVDGRTWAEYQIFNIPGGISCPNAELPLRIDRLAPNPKTKIVVNCAGRTRSIIGAQTLIDFGVPNEVVALENGTQGWWLKGLKVEKGADRQAPAATGDAAALASKREKSAAHAKRHGVRTLTAADVQARLNDLGRTTYLFDIRTAEEFAKGAITGFTHAPGGQLQQATDQWVGVRGAQIVLADADGIRAPMVAAWLRQLGHAADVMADDAAARQAFAASGIAAKRSPAFAADRIRLAEISPTELANGLAAGTLEAIDLRSSAEFLKQRIPGSRWSIRPVVATAIRDSSRPVVLIADDPNIARIAALDVREAGVGDVRLLAGGIGACAAADLKLDSGGTVPPDRERIDFIFHTLGRNEGNLDAARAYIAWEVGLVDQLDAQERGAFRL
ncbi:MAG: rhodanese-like domain-containing protein [Hyphomicrobiaceae bacterium]